MPTGIRRSIYAVLVVLAAPALAQSPSTSPPAAAAQAPAIDPQALALFKRSTDYLAGLKAFTVDAASSLEVVLQSGQKIQFLTDASLSLQRPDRFVAHRKGELVDQYFFFDGKTLTLWNPGQRVFGRVPAPGTIDGALDLASQKLDIVAPGGDLLYSDAYTRLTQNVVSGFVVGKAYIDGVRCDHLAFRNADVDWQVWIADDARALPMRLVIVTTYVTGMPEFVVQMSNWNTAPTFKADTFTFTPPSGARQIDFLPPASAGAQ
jgi:hypothetical protein